MGRLPGNTVAVDDPEVSGTHLILRWLAPEDGGAPCWQARHGWQVPLSAEG